MSQKMFLFSVALVFVFSVCSQPRQAMAQSTAGPVINIIGPIGIGSNQKLQGLFLSGPMNSDNIKLIVAIMKPFSGDEPCSLEVPTEVSIKPEITAIKIERSGDKLKINDETVTALPSCLTSGHAIFSVQLPVPSVYIDDLSNLSKLDELTKKLGLGKLEKVITSVLDENENTQTTTKEGKADWDPTFLSVHNIHI